ncbi:MAG: HAMP domain-containing histidine kinase [Actinomycetota bacterium]|nr:HAMP domain-containing histidine kinase [Actinomycetota bacterium]
MRARLPLRSLQDKLTLLLLAVVAVALGAVFLYVVPQLRSSLEQRSLRDLELAANTSTQALVSVMGTEVAEDRLNELVRGVADRADARVTLLGVHRSGGAQGPVRLYVISDSNVDPRVVESHGLAERAVRDRGLESAVAGERGGPVAKVARPLFLEGRAEWVAVYSRSLADVTETVELVRDRMLLAALIAMLVALAGGYLVAGALARRVRRLEAAADQVASGSFGEPLPIDAEDELGQLSRTFNEMRAQLSRLDRARREFIANASHELRTPIFSLGGFAELLEDEELDPETRREFLTAMREQIERLQKLSGDLLDLSRLDAGSLELRPEAVDLAELAREVAGEFTPALTRHGSALELRVPEGLEAFCDPQRAAQIVRILLDNALRHTPRGADVTVSAHRRDGVARLAVADSGPAVGGQRLDGASGQLFDRFYTADAARGSGLGLAIAKELAERMEGEIALRAGRRRTVFELTLPAQGASEGG